MSLQLYTTPLSHFGRKVRLLLDLYGLPYELFDAGNVAESQPEKFAGNPLMKVPALQDGEIWLIESDHIAAYVVRKHDPSDRLGVLSPDVFDLNARAVLNGIMTEEVKLLLAKRTGVPIENYTFFEKALAAIRQGLNWLEEHHRSFTPAQPAIGNCISSVRSII